VGWTFYNASGQQLKNTGSTALTQLDIDGGTDIGAAIVDADLFIIDDGAGGTNRKTAASRIKTYTATSTKVGTFTRDTATASGNQAITGIGFTPKALLFMGGQSSSAEIGWGLSDGTNEQDLFDRHNVGANGYGIGNNRAMTFVEDGWKDYSATVASLDSANNGGFTLTWLRTGTPTGTLTIMYLAIG
jgi:hypothetical protein